MRRLDGRRRQARAGSPGVALMTGLLLAVFVMILSLSLLALAQNDNNYLSEHERDLRAYCAAESGLDAYRVASLSITPGGAPLQGTVDPPPMSTYQQKWSVWLMATGDVKATGWLMDGTTTLATHTVMIPGGDFALEYDFAGQGP